MADDPVPHLSAPVGLTSFATLGGVQKNFLISDQPPQLVGYRVGACFKRFAVILGCNDMAGGLRVQPCRSWSFGTHLVAWRCPTPAQARRVPLVGGDRTGYPIRQGSRQCAAKGSPGDVRATDETGTQDLRPVATDWHQGGRGGQFGAGWRQGVPAPLGKKAQPSAQ